MAGQYAVVVEGLKDIDIAGLGDQIKLDAVRAINDAAEWGRAQAAKEIRDQVNFPAQYLQPGGKRLYVSKKAQRQDIEAKITARTRATSLARFITGSAPQMNKPGVTVQVQPGKARHMKRAFVVKLPAGSGPVDTKFNLGLAVRLRPGEVLRNKSDIRRLDKGLYLLYGPSVDQIFLARDGSGVAPDIAPNIATRVVNEFERLRGLRGG